ncbi:type II CAAX prenyl endopeptidase Rce1 family protein [Acidicapsa dinghuensis]|uniref:Type II CAAX prenyl endopeptidase Rce1 family protein n=1 Tax=Acidicapsa dinghuensis TaxID=2218256 RepID=A0ABW1EGC0_9BACT|nr:CPBP family intramembrane glutamic endopeptidase [Acidicapsa dinghuensis]
MADVDPHHQSSTVGISSTPPLSPIEPTEIRILKQILFGPHGLRSGWIAAGFLVVNFVTSRIFTVIGAQVLGISLENALKGFGPATAGFLEVVSFLALVTAMLLGALVARCNWLDYNLRSRHWVLQFAVGALTGAASLSLLLAILHSGGWIRFSVGDLQETHAVRFGLAWAGVFLLTGLVEEGMTRCFLLGTLTRGADFWWSSGTVAFLCLAASVNAHGNGTAGVYAAAVLGVPGCLVLHLRRSEMEGFWCAAWLTSVLFCYLHTFNRGESSVGIFGTALIGFAFCVSVWALGSAWWAIGFHAAWDWAQTFLFGTADSGMAPKDHWLTSAPAGPNLWSGGSAGPEGSVLILPLIVLVMLGLAVVASRRIKRAALPMDNLS